MAMTEPMKPELLPEDFQRALDASPWNIDWVRLFREEIREALRRAANADYVLVLREPTEAMIQDAYQKHFIEHGITGEYDAELIYKSMIAAQPITKDDSHGMES